MNYKENSQGKLAIKFECKSVNRKNHGLNALQSKKPISKVFLLQKKRKPCIINLKSVNIEALTEIETSQRFEFKKNDRLLDKLFQLKNLMRTQKSTII